MKIKVCNSRYESLKGSSVLVSFSLEAWRLYGLPAATVVTVLLRTGTNSKITVTNSDYTYRHFMLMAWTYSDGVRGLAASTLDMEV